LPAQLWSKDFLTKYSVEQLEVVPLTVGWRGVQYSRGSKENKGARSLGGEVVSSGRGGSGWKADIA